MHRSDYVQSGHQQYNQNINLRKNKLQYQQNQNNFYNIREEYYDGENEGDQDIDKSLIQQDQYQENNLHPQHQDFIINDLRAYFQHTNNNGSNINKIQQASRVQRLSSPVTQYPITEDKQEDLKADQLFANNINKKVSTNRITEKDFQYYKIFKNIEKVKDKNIIYKKKSDLKFAMLKPLLKNDNILPKKFGIKIDGEDELLSLNLNRINAKDADLKIINNALKHEKFSGLETLKLQNNDLKGQQKQIKKLIESIPKNVEELKLGNNKFGSSSINIISPLFNQQEFRKLKQLNLEKNNLNDIACIEIMKYMEENTCIFSLDLSLNNITDKSMPQLKKLLTKSSYIMEIYLHWNNITGKGACILAEGLKENSNLAVLDLSQNSIGNQNINNKQGGLEIIKSISSKQTGIRHLDMSFNKISKKEGLLIKQELKNNTKLYGFHFEGNSGAYVNSRQQIEFRTENEKNQQRENFLKHRIQGVKPIDGLILDDDNFGKTDICWICQGWHEVKFEFSMKGQEENDNPVYVHLDFEKNIPIQLEQQGSHFFCYRMCPPNRKMNFFFTNPMDNNLGEINTDYPMEKNQNFKQNETIDIKYPNGQIKTIEEPHKFNIELPQKQAQVVDEKTYEAVIVAEPRNDGKQCEYEYIPAWSLPISIMYPWKPESEEQLAKSFQTDFNFSKIHKLAKGQEDLEQLKEILQEKYLQIRFIYKYYSSLQLNQDIFSIPINIFTDFCYQMPKILDNKTLNLSDIDVNFTAFYKGTEKSDFNPERSLIRYQFMEILLRIAHDKYIKNGDSKQLTTALLRILQDGVNDMLESAENTQYWRDTRYWNQECDNILKKYEDFLKQLYNKYSGIHSSKQKKFTTIKYLANTEFKKMWLDLNLFDDLFCDKDPLVFFNLSMMAQVDELQLPRFMQMNFVEFLESVARIAEKLSPIHPDELPSDWNFVEKIRQPLHHKLEYTILLMQEKLKLLEKIEKEIKESPRKSINNQNLTNQQSQVNIQQQYDSDSDNNSDTSQRYRRESMLGANLDDGQNASSSPNKKGKQSKKNQLKSQEVDEIYEAYAQIYGVKKSLTVQNIQKLEIDEELAMLTKIAPIFKTINSNSKRKSIIMLQNAGQKIKNMSSSKRESLLFNTRRNSNKRESIISQAFQQ